MRRRGEHVHRLSNAVGRGPTPWRRLCHAIWTATVTAPCLLGPMLLVHASAHTDALSEAPPVSFSWIAAPYPSCHGAPPLLAPGETLCVIYQLTNLTSTPLRLSRLKLVLDPHTLPSGCPASSLDLTEAGVNGFVTVPGHKEVTGPTGLVTMKTDTPEACKSTRFDLIVSSAPPATI